MDTPLKQVDGLENMSPSKIENPEDTQATIEAYRHWIKALSMKVATPHQVQTANDEADRLRVDLRKAHAQM